MRLGWFLLWFVLSGILIGASVWSTLILLRQKKAWEAYAKKTGLTFVRGSFMAPASMTGFIGDYHIAFFSAERQDSDARKKRYVTAVEITMPEGLVDGGAAGTPEMIPFIESLGYLRPYKVESQDWDPAHRFYAKDKETMAAFLTPGRVTKTAEILKIRNADVLLLFDDKRAVIRVETTDPLEEPQKIDKTVRRILSAAEGLRVRPEKKEDEEA